MYPPCVFVYAKSVGSWMPLGHIHIQLYNEMFVVHANTNQLKYMAIHSWYQEVWAHKTSPTPPILFEVFIPSKEGELSCICVLAVYNLPLRLLDQILELFSQCSIFCFHSIPESGLTTLKNTATPVTIDNDAGIRPTTNVKSSKPCILGYIKDKLNDIASVQG